ncbi:MAG: phospholipid carrier-dependent glycosyltransferase [Hyphomicrobiales bacterium]|nr:phospholipid carrier-dependent glycosyltransferase [Hyphomicrobiales bacterium]MBV9426653.1 phospholipid carrier-dependent glycosyltransferase [Bradyrhizobiaceae bacterium]
MTSVRAGVNRMVWPEVRLERLLLGLLALALLFAFIVLCRGLFQPLLDNYDSRQTQTALTTFWLMRGGPIFAYETPVVGYPWSIPYEFPIYQIIVALLSAAGIPLDAAGRIVSFAFFTGCLWPMYVLFRALRFERLAFLCVAIIFVLSPEYIFWARTFMIETCALFFSLCWLAYFAKYLADRSARSAAIAVAAGALGILAKSTTFPTFAVVGGLLFLKECHAAWTSGLLTKKPGLILPPLLVLVVPFLVGGAWTFYSDTVKEGNEIGARLTSTALALWNFGTWEQRISSTLWRDVILNRSLKDAFGYAAIPAVVLIGASFLRRQYFYAALVAILAFMVPFLVFTNLHIQHSYYQTANAIFIIAAAGLGVAAVMDTRRNALGLVLLLLICAGQLLYFKSAYARLVTGDFTARADFRIAAMARARTPPDSSLLVLGQDWSSTVAYYAQRKSLTVPDWMRLGYWQRMLAEPQKFLGPVPLGGIIVCTDYLPKDERKTLVEQSVSGRRVLGEAGDCTLYAAEKK